ncbi:MAG: amidohydrolase family protein [Solirubrobacteraceae bacterium]
MPINGSVIDPRLKPVYSTGYDELAAPLWFDAHTHIGHNDPDGRTATAEEVVEGLDAAGHDRALLFAMHEPDGYPRANDAVLEACAASGGRLLPLSRIAPNAEGALAEAERCLAAGTRGFKLHPRSDAFGLPHPVVEQVVALAHEARAPVLFHAGRGIPHLGEAVVDLARDYPGARLILAHAGISDLGWIADAAAQLGNLYFDTAWWQVADQLQLYATIPPGQILYASDMPYGPGTFAGLMFRRVSAAVGLGAEQRHAIAGGQLERVVAGEDPADLGPAPGLHAVGERVIEAERVVTYCSTALQLGFRGLDPSEAVALARVACRTCREAGPVRDLLAYADRLLAIGQDAAAADPEKPFAAVPAALLALTLAGTPEAGVPDVPV